MAVQVVTFLPWEAFYHLTSDPESKQRAIRSQSYTSERLCTLRHYPAAATSPSLMVKPNSGILELAVI